ncbi:proline-specific permease ProY, partial [Pantoea ananatis]|nr:proline-specific permease ProY [Pantoea ananatis]
QMAFRRKIGKAAARTLTFALPGGSWTAGAGVAFLCFIIGLIGYFPDTRVSLYVGMVWIVVLLLGYKLVRK